MSYTINGVQMPPTTGIEDEITDLYGENTGRDEAGHTHLDLVRPYVRKYQVNHEMLTASQVAMIRGALNPRGFSVSIESNTFRAYAGATTSKVRAVTAQGKFYDINFSIIEI